MNAPMEMLLATLAAVLLLLAAVYVHLVMPAFIAGEGKIALTRAVLIGAGVLVGVAGYLAYPGASAVAAFLAGFGMVHIPAAAILFIKQERRAGKT
jgi:primosomal replication protein N